MERRKGPLFLFVCALCLGSRAGLAACFVPLDQSPGWKRVALPSAAPWLVAVGAQQQYRSDEAALLWSEGSVDFRGATRVSPERTDYLFLVGERVRHLEVEFEADLQDARVDAEGWAGVRAPLQTQVRTSGQFVQIDWTQPGLAPVTVTVHHPSRHPPMVHHARGGSYAVMTHEAWLPASYKSAHALYYLQPSGQEIQICSISGSGLTLEVERTTIDGTPQAVAVSSVAP